jgi:hypothetical protein
MEIDAEKQCKHQTEAKSQADMWQFRILHIPQRTKSTLYKQNKENQK